MNRRAARRVGGFSLAELLAVSAIVGIISAISVPGFRALMDSQRTRNASYEFFSAVQFARSEAIKRNGRVSIVPAGGNWASGWTVLSATGETLASQTALGQVTITLAPATLTFAANGRLPTGTATAAFQIDTGATPTNNVRCVQVDLSGLPRGRKGTCS